MFARIAPAKLEAQICNPRQHMINFYSNVEVALKPLLKQGLKTEQFATSYREKSLMKYLNIIIIILFMFSASASAEFYKYVDEEGNVRFTDDINQVPEAQRAKIRSYIESESQEPAEQESARENKAEQTSEDQQTDLSDLSDNESESLEDAKKRIDELKSEIDQEYETLMKEKEQLAKDKEKAKTREQIIEFNKKVDTLNKRVAAYEKKGQDYKALVDAYNKRIMKQHSEDQTQ